MIQDILTYLTIAFAVSYTLYSLVQVVINSLKKNTSGCANCSGGCGIKQLKMEN